MDLEEREVFKILLHKLRNTEMYGEREVEEVLFRIEGVLKQSQQQLLNELEEKIQAIKENIPPYPWEVPDEDVKAETVSWAAQHAHYEALKEIKALIQSKKEEL